MSVSRGLVAARRRCCTGGVLSLTENHPMCVNWRHNDNWDHPCCGEPKENRPTGVVMPGSGSFLAPDAFLGPAGYCPLGLWMELAPLDMDVLEEVSRQRMLDMERVVTLPRVRQWMTGLPRDARSKLLRNLIETAVLCAETAQELAICEGLPFCP